MGTQPEGREARRVPLREQLYLVLSTGLIGGVGGLILYSTGIGEELEGPFIKEEGLTPALINSLLLMVLLLAGAFILLFILVRLRRRSVFRLVAVSSFFAASLLVGEVYLAALLPPSPLTLALTWLLGLAATAIVTKRAESRVAPMVQVVVGALVGPIVTFMVTPTSVVLMLLAASLYDVYAVFRGPLRSIVEETAGGEGGGGDRGGSILTPLAVRLGAVMVGMGDVILYSAFSALALTSPYPSPIRLACVEAAVFLGVYATFRMLERRRAMPALPLPITAGVAAYAMAVLIGL